MYRKFAFISRCLSFTVNDSCPAIQRPRVTDILTFSIVAAACEGEEATSPRAEASCCVLLPTSITLLSSPSHQAIMLTTGDYYQRVVSLPSTLSMNNTSVQLSSGASN